MLLSPEIRPIVMFYLNSKIPVFADASLAAFSNVPQLDQMGPDSLQLRLAIRAAKNTLMDAKRKQIVDESIANINEKAQLEMQSIVEFRLQSSRTIEKLSPVGKCQETRPAAGLSDTAIVLEDPQSAALTADSGSEMVMANSVNHGEIEIDPASAIEVAQTKFQESTGQTTEVPAVSCSASSPPILDQTYHPITVHPECINEGTRSVSTSIPQPALAMNSSNSVESRTTNCGQLAFAQSVPPGELVDNSLIGDCEAVRTASSEVGISENEDFVPNVQQLRMTEEEPDTQVLNRTADIGIQNVEKGSTVLVRPPHMSIMEDEGSRTAPVPESNIGTPKTVHSNLGNASADTQPIFDSEGSSYRSFNSAASNHAEHSNQPEAVLMPDSQSSSREIAEHLHESSDDKSGSLALPSDCPNGDDCSAVTSASVVVLPVGHSPDAIKSQPAAQPPQEGLKVTRRRIRKRAAEFPYTDASAELAVSVSSSCFAIVPPLSHATPSLTDLRVDQSYDASLSGNKRSKKRGRKSKQQKSSSDNDSAKIDGSMHVRQGSINDCIVVCSKPNAGAITPSQNDVLKRERLAMEPEETFHGKFTRGKRGRSKLMLESSESDESSPVEPSETPTKRARVTKSSFHSSRIHLSSTRQAATPRKSTSFSSIHTGVEDEEEDEIQSSPVGGSSESFPYYLVQRSRQKLSSYVAKAFRWPSNGSPSAAVSRPDANSNIPTMVDRTRGQPRLDALARTVIYDDEAITGSRKIAAYIHSFGFRFPWSNVAA
ncbi:hypothetical protein V1509DRAFT_634113 [Lipomyces kononenkoae]